MFGIEIDDIPYDAIKLYKRENLILKYKRDIEEIVKWLVMLFKISTFIVFKNRLKSLLY